MEVWDWAASRFCVETLYNCWKYEILNYSIMNSHLRIKVYFFIQLENNLKYESFRTLLLSIHIKITVNGKMAINRRVFRSVLFAHFDDDLTRTQFSEPNIFQRCKGVQFDAFLDLTLIFKPNYVGKSYV